MAHCSFLLITSPFDNKEHSTVRSISASALLLSQLFEIEMQISVFSLISVEWQKCKVGY